MFAAALRRYIRNGAFQNFQQRLLDTLTADIAGDGRIFGFAGDFINLIHIDDTAFGTLNVVIRRLNDAQQNVFNILADIAGFRKRGRVRDGKRHIQYLRERLRKHGFTDTGRTEQ
ncbi:hypothetical protein SDC9_196727 [bioreactor metagenome]|uniref:Uncharacterized protein n=1 Tax=bioreactor metagenome TaxID=1076179 RepID=A0A645ILC2_9ZZZZ